MLITSSGNEAVFSLETASDYVKDEKACFYGFKCVAVGYEFNPGSEEVHILIILTFPVSKAAWAFSFGSWYKHNDEPNH